MASILSLNSLAQAEIIDKKPSEIFKRPFITGASVSGDTGTMSPGKRLALRYTQPHEIQTLARGGTPGREVLKAVLNRDLSDRSVILGIDLFFWDSTRGAVSESLQSMKALVEKARSLDIPIVLGEIPELLPEHQPHRNALNKGIAEACRSYPQCRLMPFDSMLKQILRDGYLVINGRRRSIPELIPDGLHLSDLAGEYLADQMLANF